MREKKYHLYLTADEQSKVIQSLIDLKNNLIAQGRYGRKSFTVSVTVMTKSYLLPCRRSEMSEVSLTGLGTDLTPVWNGVLALFLGVLMSADILTPVLFRNMPVV